MKYSVVTFGCRVNQADSLGFEEELCARGATAADPRDADLVIVNTCSVTASADQGARQTIRRIARENPGVRIVVTGCYATREADAVRQLPSVTQVVANEGKPRLVSVLSPSLFAPEELSTAERFGDGDGSCGAPLAPGLAGRTAFTLRVQTGCSEPCTYCIIPSTRGEPRSRPIAVVLAEVERAAAAGFKEVVLTGVHLGSYGRDVTPASSLIALLRALAEYVEQSGAELLFRVSSLEPMDCSPAVVELMASAPCFAAHFHLPLQHASDRLLAWMKRPYTRRDYGDLVETIRTRMPDASIGSDVIVGFPGEADADFEELASYLERSPLTHLHVFPYSDRPGTAASRMTPKVHGSAIRERAQRVREIGRALNGRFVQAQIGSTHRALTIDDGAMAVTGNYLKVAIPAGRPRNEWVDVRVERANGSLVGVVRSP